MAQPVDSPTVPAAPDSNLTPSLEVACPFCAYVLHKFKPGMRCVECGAIVDFADRTIPFNRSDPLFLQRISIGCALIAIASAMTLAYSLTWRFDLQRTLDRDLRMTVAFIHHLSWGSTSLLMIGGWLLGTPEPIERRSDVLRIDRAVRAASLALLLYPAAIYFGWRLIWLAALTEALTSLAFNTLVWIRLRQHASRTSEEDLDRRALFLLIASIGGVTITQLLPAIVDVMHIAGNGIPDVPNPIVRIVQIGWSLASIWLLSRFARVFGALARQSRSSADDDVPAA